MKNIEIMDTNLIQPGQIYNYTQLCELLDQPVYHGNQKTHQLKEFERFFSYERNETKNGKPGSKFTIIDVYEKPMERNSWIAHNAKYVGLIQDVLLGYLLFDAKTGDGFEPGDGDRIREDVGSCTTHISTNGLMELLGMVNKKYVELKGKNKQIISEGRDNGVELENDDIDEFYLRSGSRCNGIITGAMDSLKRRGIIKYSRVYRICEKRVEFVDFEGRVKKEWYEYRDADDKDMEFIVDREYKVMRELGIRDKNEVLWNKRLGDEYYKKLDRVFEDEKGWVKVFKTYKIWYSRDGIGDLITERMRDEDAYINRKKLELNGLVIDALQRQLENKTGAELDDIINERMSQGKGIYGKYLYYLGHDVKEKQEWLSDWLVRIKEKE